MHDRLSAYAPTLGRILVGGYFLWSGIQMALQLPGAVAQVGAFFPTAPIFLTLLIIAAEVLGGVAMVVDYHTRLTALALALFTIAALSAGPFVLERVAVVGGLLFIAGTTKPRS
jgi:putative oxidoreductase